MERINRNKYLTIAILATILIFSATLQSGIIPIVGSAQPQGWVFEAWEGELVEHNIKAWWEPPEPERQICIWAEGLPPFATFEPVCSFGSVIGVLVIAPDFGDAGSYSFTFYFGEILGVPTESEPSEIIVYAVQPPDDIVIEEVIVPENLTTDLIAFRLSVPLRPGDVVTPSVSEPGHRYEANGTVWFYWINDCPYAMFAHKTRYVFVDNATGGYEVMYENWPPALNGEEIWRTPEEYWNPENWVYSSTTNFSQPTATIEIGGSVNLVASKSSSAMNPENQPCKQALIIEGHNPYGSDFKNASELWYNLMINFSYTDEEIIYLTPGIRPKTDFICSKENVTSVIQSLANTLNPGDNLTLFIIAHGYLLDDNHTGIIFLNNWADQLYDWELNQSLGQIEDGVNMTIAFESCYSGGFMDDLWTLGNVKVMITSTDWKSESYYASAGLDPPTFYNGIKPEEWAWNDTNIWDEGGEFSSGLIERLNELKDSFAANQITLGDLYVNACKRAKEVDAGYQNGDVLKAHYNDSKKKPNPLFNTVFFEGDITHEGMVNILDISKTARAFGTKPGYSNWDPEADVDKSREINIVDIAKIAVKFGTKYY